jgi:hypothetical protein
MSHLLEICVAAEMVTKIESIPPPARGHNRLTDLSRCDGCDFRGDPPSEKGS